jgi:hypothetical protein
MLTNADGTKILIPTGRGSYVFFGEKSLEKLLATFDLAHPEHTVMSKEAVIAAYREAEQHASK